MQFWHICSPDYDSDYQSTLVNGKAVHPFGLPGIACDVCHEKWGGNRVLPFECPTSLRNNERINKGWPISPDCHRLLQMQVQSAFKSVGIICAALQPGDDFQPCYVDIASNPKVDFLWASYKSLVVSKRIKDYFDAMAISNLLFCPITFRLVNKRKTRVSVSEPPGGEPEAVIMRKPFLVQTDSVESYFELVIQSISSRAPGFEPALVCSGCGRETYRNDKDRFRMNNYVWNGEDIFLLAGTSYVVITDKLRQALQEIKATNVGFKTMEC